MRNRVASTLGGAAALGLLLGACSSGSGESTSTEEPPPPPTANLVVKVTFPDEPAQKATVIVHAWAVVSKLAEGATCSALVGGQLDPYDPSLHRRADIAAVPGDPLEASEVLLGSALVYVRAVGFDGKAAFAGCVPVEVVEPSTEAAVTMTTANAFDCADPETKDGAACDDGKRCTVGETCSKGKCTGGVARDCTHVADVCNAESCDETAGCVATPLPDKTPCDDSLFCTDGDVCMAGGCAGVAKDCNLGAPPCKIAVSCSEASNSCIYTNAPSGTPCDDGKYCTENDTCSSFGTCNGSTRDCSSVADQCNNASCDEVNDTCAPVPKSSIYSCTDNLTCTVGDKCDGAGSCQAGVAVNCSSLDDQCNTGTCTEPAGSCAKVPKANGTPCDDLNPATLNDMCTNGACAGT